MSTSKYNAQIFIDAIVDSGGIISTIARRVGCKWFTAKRWITEDPDVNQAYQDEKESMLDLAEGVIKAGIESGDSSDARWFLTKKGKERGYGDHKDINITGEQLINIVFDEWNEDERTEDKSTTEESTTSDTVEGISEP